MADVSFLPAPRRDYRETLAWYQERSARAAARFEAAIELALPRINENLEEWPLCDERHRFYILRQYPYSIVCRVEPIGVLVVAVAHGSRSSTY